ncbi:MAG: hypothetical protein Q8O53_02490 [Candidatus Moranbacteria bacterium]|nr:hypothetical protein [Candidatus Moranbacteria bacterium]
MTEAQVSVPAGRSDAQIRAAVFLYKPKTILVKVLTMGIIDGVFSKPRENETIEVKHTYQAIDNGLNPLGVRSDRTDTGFCLFEKEEGVRAGLFLAEMWNASYMLKAFHWQNQNNKGPVNTFQFVLCGYGQSPADGIRMPPQALDILRTARFNHATVWCNLRDGDDGKQFRLDTINLAKGRRTPEPSRQLHMVGSTYRLE